MARLPRALEIAAERRRPEDHVGSQHLTFMFTDIVGSTALFSRLAPLEADRLRGRHFHLLGSALASAGGWMVKNLGDGAMAAFAASSQAMVCAVFLQQRMLADREGAGHSLELRIGLSTGEVTAEDDDYFGDPVVEAARLCAVAEPGQILASSKIRMVAGRYATQKFEALGEMSLKGLPDPVEVEAILWEPAPAFEFPVQLRLRRQEGFLGREDERAQLAEAFRSAAAEGPGLAFVIGEAGIGKTTLASEFALSAHENGAIVLLGRCDEHLRVPFHPFEEALSHYVACTSEMELAEYVGAHGSDLARLVPELARRVRSMPAPTSSDPGTERHALFKAVTSLLSSASRSHPMVLVLDDLHFADEDSLQLLRHVATSGEPSQLFVVCVFREAELSPVHPLLGVLASIAREATPLRVALEGWRDSEVASLLAGDSDGSPSQARELAELLVRETGGNPFLVTEMLHHLSDSGVLRRRADGTWIVSGELTGGSLPASVRQVLTERMRQLGESGQEVLQAAAVIGREFDLELLGRVTGRRDEELIDILEAATTASLVREIVDERAMEAGEATATITFHQAVIRRALYDSIRPSRKMLFHRRVAEALEAMKQEGRSASDAALAYHFAAAGPEHGAKALRYSIDAADEALRRLAPQEATRHYEAALRFQAKLAARDASLHLDLLIGLGNAQRQAGIGEYRARLLEAAALAVELDDGSRLVRAALANTRGFTSISGEVDDGLVGLLELALSKCPPDEPERAMVLAALCSELQYHPDAGRRRRLAREAEELCAALGDDLLAVTVTNRMFSAVQATYSLGELLQKTESTLLAAERLADPVQLFWARLWRTYALRSAGSEREAGIQLALAADAASALGQPLLMWWATNVQAVGALIAGDPAEAERLANLAEALGTRTSQPDARSLHQAITVCATWERGELGALGPLIDAALETQPDFAPLLIIRTLAYTDADDLAGCRKMLEASAPRVGELPLDSVLVVHLSVLAEAAIRSGDEASALVLLEALAPWSEHVAHMGAAAIGPVSHFMGGLCSLLGRDGEADEWYERSAVVSEVMSARFFGARTALDRGAMLAARGGPRDLDRARALLLSSQATAIAHGYSVVERRAASALEQLAESDGPGAHPPPETAHGAGAHPPA